MRTPIRAAVAFLLMLDNRNRIDLTLVLAWTGVATALSIVLLVLALR
jgi:hypothetical protein